MSHFDSAEDSDIIRRIYNYELYNTLSNLFDPLSFLAVIIFTLTISAASFGSSYIILTPLILVGLLWSFLARWVNKRKSKYEIRDDEYVGYYSFFIRNPLERSKGAKQSVKEDYYKEAIKIAKKFLKIVKERWTIGKFKLSREAFAEPLKNFISGFQFRVIPSLKRRDEKETEIIIAATNYLENHSKNFQLENIITFNDMISQLPDERQNIKSYFKKMGNWIDNHKLAKTSLYLIFIFIGCSLFAYFSLVYFAIPREYAYAGTIAVFIALIEIIFHKKEAIE